MRHVMKQIEFRDDIERRFWGDIFARLLSEATQKNTGAYAYEMRTSDRECAKRAADEALIELRVRQRVITKLGREPSSYAPVGYSACAVCEGRTEHVDGCENFDLKLPISFDLEVLGEIK